MKQSQLKELIQHITRSVLKEFTSLSSTDTSSTDTSQDPSLDTNVPPTDSMSPALKARVDREKDKQRRDSIKNKEAELKTTKSKMDMQKREGDQMRRITKPGLEKDIQRLKGAKI